MGENVFERSDTTAIVVEIPYQILFWSTSLKEVNKYAVLVAMSTDWGKDKLPYGWFVKNLKPQQIYYFDLDVLTFQTWDQYSAWARIPSGEIEDLFLTEKGFVKLHSMANSINKAINAGVQGSPEEILKSLQ